MHIHRISVAKYPYPIRIRSNKEITIRILSVSVRIADIRKISIRGYISAHLCSVGRLVTDRHLACNRTLLYSTDSNCSEVFYERSSTSLDRLD